jgi:CTP:molybdopterin cytidylyltransferase MocA
MAGALDDLRVRIVRNADYESGQASSLKAGVRTATELAADAVVVVLADQPGISSETIDRLIAARRDSGSWIGMATYGQERGHPVLFGHEVFAELEGISGDQGGKDVIKRHGQRVVLADGGREQVPMDVDTEADVLALSQSSLVQD